MLLLFHHYLCHWNLLSHLDLFAFSNQDTLLRLSFLRHKHASSSACPELCAFQYNGGLNKHTTTTASWVENPILSRRKDSIIRFTVLRDFPVSTISSFA